MPWQQGERPLQKKGSSFPYSFQSNAWIESSLYNNYSKGLKIVQKFISTVFLFFSINDFISPQNPIMRSDPYTPTVASKRTFFPSSENASRLMFAPIKNIPPIDLSRNIFWENDCRPGYGMKL